MSKFQRVFFLSGVVLGMTGCAATYGNFASSNNLGAGEYQPAVLVPPGKESQYQAILMQCRKVALNRQITSAGKAQSKTIGGAVEGAATGAATGLQMQQIFSQAGFDSSSYGKSMGIGAGIGLLGSLGSSFASGADHVEDETRDVLLSCLRSQSKKFGYTVLE